MKTYDENEYYSLSKFDLDLKIDEIDNQLTNLKDMEDVFLDDLVLVETD